MSIAIKDIVEGINLKDLKAWEKLYSKYYSTLCVYANNIVKDPDASQDIVQDTLIKVWDSNRQFAGMKEFTWYLYRSVYNNSLYYLRSCQSQENLLRKLQPEDAEMSEEQFALTVQEELIRQLYVYIEELPEERKKILMLSIKGYSGNEIAVQLGISITTVKTQKYRSFRFLREKLKDSILLFLI